MMYGSTTLAVSTISIGNHHQPCTQTVCDSCGVGPVLTWPKPDRNRAQRRRDAAIARKRGRR